MMMPSYKYNYTFERLWKAAEHLGLDGDNVVKRVQALVNGGDMPYHRARESVIFYELAEAGRLDAETRSMLCDDSVWKRLAGDYVDARIAEEARG